MPDKRITKPGSTPIDNSFTWDKFVKDCATNKYVLVIGSEAVLNKRRNVEANGNSTSLLFNLTLDYLKTEKGVSIDINQNKDFSQLSRKVLDLRANVIETIKDLNFESAFEEEIEPSLKKLIETKCFRLVLTTTIDPYIELLMERIWGKKGFRTLNLYGSNKDILSSEQAFGEFNELEPTLYYVFGKADTENIRSNFVLSENDAMSAISKWFSSERPIELLKYLQGEDMKILTIGCGFDNWLFRFFWYVLRGNVTNLSTGQVAVELDKDNDSKLIQYLKDEKIKHFPDARSFMEEATSRINQIIDLNRLPRKQAGIFISYASEDKYLALRLFGTLYNQGWNVWLDEDRLGATDEYRKRIDTAIKKCKIFMPILSSQTKYDLEKLDSGQDFKNSNRFYINTEWVKAQERYEHEETLKSSDLMDSLKMKVLPFVVGQQYDVRSSYQQRMPSCIINATAFDAPQSIESLVSLINQLIN